MAKKKRSKASMIDCAVRLPIEVIARFEHVAAMSGLTVNDVINVVLCMHVLSQRGRMGKEVGRE